MQTPSSYRLLLTFYESFPRDNYFRSYLRDSHCHSFFFFFFNDPAPPEISTLSLPDPLPISSPMNFSTVPPNASISERTRAKYGVRIARTSSGSSFSARAVKPTRSAKSTVTTFRSSARQIGRATSELQSPCNLVCRLLLEKKK